MFTGEVLRKFALLQSKRMLQENQVPFGLVVQDVDEGHSRSFSLSRRNYLTNPQAFATVGLSAEDS